MCNACGNYCCGSDMFYGCGCDGCSCSECWSEDDDEFGDGDDFFCEPIDEPPQSQAGPLMVRHVIDGHDVLLPADAKLHPPAKPGDDPSDCPLGGTF